MKSSPSYRCVLVTLLSFIMMGAAVAAPAAPPAAPVDVNVDRPDGIYQAGQEATFTVTTLPGVAPTEATAAFCVDGTTTIGTEALQLKGEPVRIKKTLDKPGQLICTIKYKTQNGDAISEAGAYFDPYAIKPATEVPADFDEFWARQKASLAGDYQAEVTPVESGRPNVDLFHVKIPMPDGPPVQGYMAKPHGAAPKSIGAVAYTHGAGVRSSNKPGPAMGMIAFDFNAHGIDDGQTKDFYTKLDKGELSDYRRRGWDKPETVYFVGMYKRLLRAIDFLTKQPEWDGKNLIVFGGSQGGAQAIAAGALDPRVSVVVAGIPALCDLNGYKAGRYCGWPRSVALGADGQPVNPTVAETARYIDSVSLASRVKCDAFFMTGLIDRTCMSNSVMPAYNSLQSQRKMIIFQPKLKHVFAGPDRRAAEKFITTNLRK
ncbi:MAG: acetylxylan esterase [Candidatus Sumerlaeia bacterium]